MAVLAEGGRQVAAEHGLEVANLLEGVGERLMADPVADVRGAAVWFASRSLARLAKGMGKYR